MVFQRLLLEDFYLKRIFFVSFLICSTAGWSNGLTFIKLPKRIVSKAKNVKILPSSASSSFSKTKHLNGRFFNLNIDKPDKIRKFHSKPTPLAGGQMIFLNILVYCVILNFFEDLLIEEIFFKDLISLNYFMFFSFSIFLLGFLDDKFNIKANYKFSILFLIILFLLLLDNSLIIYNIKLSFINDNFILDKVYFLFKCIIFLR